MNPPTDHASTHPHHLYPELISRLRHQLECGRHATYALHLLSDLHDQVAAALLTDARTSLRRVYLQHLPNTYLPLLLGTLPPGDVQARLSELYQDATLLGTPISRRDLAALFPGPADLPHHTLPPGLGWRELPQATTRKFDPLGFCKVTAELRVDRLALTVALPYREAELLGLLTGLEQSAARLPPPTQQSGDYLSLLRQAGLAFPGGNRP
ncbi:hypothetical protein [Deinococcus petrolearius]|uniref:Uncharacterized protein n=1 Tax=Deinococcus petrolearius TaxID=1751295 RepID=A0ABW1DL73_9DEIO